MLIWIKAPCVAIGVLAAFVLLLSTVVSEDVSTNTTAENLDLPSAELTTLDELDELQLGQLPFADRLTNTCDLQNDRTSYAPLGGHMAHYRFELLRDMLVYVNFTKRRALEVLQNQSINNCDTLHISNLPHTPTLEELTEMDVGRALNKIYSSLLVHSGYSYFIYHQFVNSDIRCSGDINGEQRLAELSRDLAGKQRYLACKLHLGMRILGYTQDDISTVLSERITNAPQCSLRALRDCQVMKSINNFLDIVTKYILNYTSVSTTSLPHIQRTTP